MSLSILIIGLLLYSNVHTSHNYFAIDFAPFLEMSPFLHNTTCPDLSYQEWSTGQFTIKPPFWPWKHWWPHSWIFLTMVRRLSSTNSCDFGPHLNLRGKQFSLKKRVNWMCACTAPLLFAGVEYMGLVFIAVYSLWRTQRGPPQTIHDMTSFCCC